MTVADVPTTTLSTLTQAQRAAFRQGGCLVFERVLSSDDLADVRAASERLQSVRQRRGGDRLAIVNNVAFMDHVFLRLARHAFMLGVVSDLIGPNLRLQHAKLNGRPRPLAPARWAGTRIIRSFRTPTTTWSRACSCWTMPPPKTAACG